MLPIDVAQVLEDIKLSTKKLSDKEIIDFSRKAGKPEVEEIRRLGKLLSNAIVEDNTAACEKITITITKIVKGL